jgi:hypothetical protein
MCASYGKNGWAKAKDKSKRWVIVDLFMLQVQMFILFVLGGERALP